MSQRSPRSRLRSLRPRGAGACRQRPHIWLLALLALFPGCSPLRFAEALLVGDHFVLRSDLAYGHDPRQRLDVYRPLGSGGLRPVVLFLFGGRWQQGSRDQYRLLGDALTRRGLVAVVPDYRLYPQVRFPAWVEDAAHAVRWTRENIRQFGGDPDRIVVVGHSAGGHTAALLALDPRYLEQAGARNALRGVISIAGPVDTVWTDADVQALMGPQSGWDSTYPLNHIGGSDSPILLLHGAADETVAPGNSVALAARIARSGGCARAIVYPGVGHVEIVIALAVPRLRIAPVLDHVAAFASHPAAMACAGRGATQPGG